MPQQDYGVIPLSERVNEFFKKEIAISNEKGLKNAFMTLLDLSFFEKDIDLTEFYDVKHYLSDVLARNALVSDINPLEEKIYLIDLYIPAGMNPPKHEAKEKADFLMFMVGIFPKYIRRKGLNIDYYVIGASSLYRRLVNEGLVFKKLSYNTKPFVESLNIMSSKYLKIEKEPNERFLLH
ncbi:MAG: hypothetical protein N3D84_01995 [Candidatus Woesearchaeota archaeon]|nr:hypothetical protein [Candidatus Woesearchaeota archaeon]